MIFLPARRQKKEVSVYMSIDGVPITSAEQIGNFFSIARDEEEKEENVSYWDSSEYNDEEYAEYLQQLDTEGLS